MRCLNPQAIGLHTFVVVWFRKGAHNLKVALWLIALQWAYVILFVIIAGAAKGFKNYDDPALYWCWIGERYRGERIAGEYFWLWLTLGVSVAVYVPMFLWTRGNLVVDKNRWWKVAVRLHPRAPGEEDGEMRMRPSRPSLALLACVPFYPFKLSYYMLNF